MLEWNGVGCGRGGGWRPRQDDAWMALWASEKTWIFFFFKVIGNVEGL